MVWALKPELGDRAVLRVPWSADACEFEPGAPKKRGGTRNRITMADTADNRIFVSYHDSSDEARHARGQVRNRFVPGIARWLIEVGTWG